MVNTTSIEFLGILGHIAMYLVIQFLSRKDCTGDEPLTLEELQEWAEEEKLPPRFRAGPGRKSV